MNEDGNWTTETLLTARSTNPSPRVKALIKAELVEGADPGILITMTEFGDLQLIMSVSGSQILVDTLLWPVDEVTDPAAFNVTLF